MCDELGIAHVKNNEDGWVRTKLRDDMIHWMDNNVDNKLIPNVTGMTLRDALFLLENKGLRVKVLGNGRVSTQSIRPGIKLNEGEEIILELS